MKFIKNIIFSSVFKMFWIFNLIGAALTGFALSIAKRYDLMGWTNAVTFGTAMLFALTWLIFANSHGVFDMLTFSVKTFWRGFKKDFEADREKENFFDYRQSKDKTEKSVYIAISLSFAVFLIATIVLFILVKK